jgi:hypothetical protein
MSSFIEFFSRRVSSFFLVLALTFAATPASASGPKYVAGKSYFNTAVQGQAIHWSGGQVNYYVDQGPLSATVSNQQATAMVDAAAALWSQVPTAAVTLTDKGPLNEDVSGSNIAVSSSGVITAPSDITPGATSYPVAVIYDNDGSIIDALYGAGTSKPDTCQHNGVFTWLDNINPDATVAHGVILLNGLCATNSDMLEMMSFQVERAFGRILGLDYAQVTPNALSDELPGGTAGWPVMQPISGVCDQNGGQCIPNPNVLRYDDIAALNRIYPVTAQNLASFPGKQLTSSSTVSIQGTISFRTGYGMQGVNVVARPLDSNGNPLYQYTVTAISGAYFNGNHGNPITGFNDANGNPLTRFGSNESSLQGFFDLSDIPLPPGVTSANYQVTFEPISPLYINGSSVGPYIDGQTTPSGSLAPIAVPALAAGSTKTLTVNVEDSAVGGYQDAIGTQAQPRSMPASGLWVGRLSQIGQSDWFTFPVRANRTFTVVTQAVDESGKPTETKAMPAIGAWDAFDAVGSTALGYSPGMNGLATGESWLRITSQGDTIVRVGIADQRGDGRPDYPYNGWLLYADTVTPQRLPAAGGPIVIHGMGFRLADTVLVGGQPALVTSISPNEITAIAPPAANGITGSVDVEVDDLPAFYAAAIATGGVSYDSGNGDALTLNTAPMNTVPVGVALPFSVTALGSDLTPAGGVTVVYTVLSGTATLACGHPVCSVIATGDGHATINVTANDSTWSIVTASLTNGSLLKAEFAGGTPPVLASITPRLSLAAGASTTWTVQALVLANGQPAAGQAVSFQSATKGIAAQGAVSSLTTANGVATYQLSVGPLNEGQVASINACLNGTSQCVTFSALGARTEYAQLAAVSGISQTLAVSGTPSQVTLRLLDMDNVTMVGGTVTLYQSLYAWTPPCTAHSACTTGALLTTQAATAVSDMNGLVTFTPATLPGVATSLLGVAASGNSATVNIAVEQHP